MWQVAAPREEANSAVRLDAALPAGHSFVHDPEQQDLALSPDGLRLVYSAREPGESPRLYVRAPR